ncbi:MAG: sugar phosphate isomerase/epimerase family protein [Bacteroidota bacterium]
MNRRNFIAGGMAAMASTPLFSMKHVLMPGAVAVPIGFQSYVLREEINKDVVGELRRMASMGYAHVEMCSPSGYAPWSFGNLVKYSGKELAAIIRDAGLKCQSSHFTWNELNNNLDERIDFAQQMGLKHMVASGGLDGKTTDELKRKCDALNKIGAKIAKAGMVAGYHNHNGEFEHQKDGRPDYDILLENLDPSVVKMQFQVAAIQVGYKAADYFRKFPGRFISAHLQDYSATNKEKQVVLGQGGIVDWKDFFAAAKTGGLQWVYVEMESDPGTLEGSLKYLKAL